MTAPCEDLVSAGWLAQQVARGLHEGPRLRILDASWYLPQMERDARREFAQGHIPGARYFDIDECADASSGLDHALPSAEIFARYVGALGVGDDAHVVVYDGSDYGAFTCTRVWWMFRYFGHSRVSVLDGGFRRWCREGHPVTAALAEPEAARFTAAVPEPRRVSSFEDVARNLVSGEFQLLDMRTHGRFSGTEPELREGMFVPDG